MLKLNKKDYQKTSGLLNVPEMNVLFAKSIVNRHVNGDIWVDSLPIPCAAYIKHPYGMSLLAGKTDDQSFLESLRNYLLNSGACRSSQEWLQVTSSGWSAQIESLLKKSLVKMPQGAAVGSTRIGGSAEKVYQYQRLLFLFRPDLFLYANIHTNSAELTVKPMSSNDFNEFGSHVVPRYFWNNEDEFSSISKGYSLVYKNRTVAVAFGSFTIDDQFEIGVETDPKFRGKGFASVVCVELINYCLENDYIPVWSCHAGNAGSKKLALRLGFEIEKTLPYYHLT